jgi:hypothetical protein
MNTIALRRSQVFSAPAAGLLVAFAVAAGCSGTKDGPGGGPDPLATESGFCKAWATNACNAVVVDRCQAPDAQSCIETQQQYCIDRLPPGYKSDNAEACLDRVKSAYADGVLSSDDIDVVLHFGPPCERLIRGPSAIGGSCTLDTDCDTLSGVRCVIKPGASEGQCHKPVEVGGGDSCADPDQVCAADFFCDDRSFCIRRLTAGAQCSADAQCGAGLRCVLGEPDDAGAPSGVCEARRGLSAVCVSNADCTSNYCSIGRGDADGLCANSIQLAQREPICENLR